jgi:hypothetical protein
LTLHIVFALHIVQPFAKHSRAVNPSGERNHPWLHFSK